MTKHTTKLVKSSELKAGDVVHFYGARFRLRDDRRVHADGADADFPVYVITGDWIDGEIIRNYFGPDTPWTFQGNDRAIRVVETN